MGDMTGDVETPEAKAIREEAAAARPKVEYTDKLHDEYIAAQLASDECVAPMFPSGGSVVPYIAIAAIVVVILIILLY